MRNILVDFDRVIHAQSLGYKKGEIYDQPVEFVKEALAILKKDYKIIVFTARKPSEFLEIERWLNRYDIKYDELTNIKKGGLIIDDHAIRFTNWRDMLNLLSEW